MRRKALVGLYQFQILRKNRQVQRNTAEEGRVLILVSGTMVDPGIVRAWDDALVRNDCVEEIEFAEEIENMRKDDIRQCTRDLLLVERAREWVLEEEE